MKKDERDREGRRGRRLTAERVVVLGLLIAAIAGLGYAVTIRPRPPTDPTRVPVERTLALARVELAHDAAGPRLVIKSSTNLPDGARIDIDLATTEVVLALAARCEGGKLVVDARPTAKVTNGSYRALASFKIEEQSLAIRDALHYQPRRLDASAPLVVSSGIDPSAELRPRLKRLIGEANNAKDLADLARVAKDAEALDRELWLSTLTPGVRRLRRALEAAQRLAKLDLPALRRDLIEADVLAGL